MKNHIALFILTGSLILGTQVPGQNAVPTDVQRAYERRLEAVEFEEIPLSEVTDRLRDEFPEVNFIIHQEVDDVIIRLQLRSVSLSEILNAIQIAAERDHVIWETGDTERLVTLRLDEAAVPGTQATRPTLRAFALRGYFREFGQELMGSEPMEAETLRALAVENLFDLLRQAVTLLGENTRPSASELKLPQLKIHPGTQTLIAVGSAEQLAVVQEIVQSLPGMPRTEVDRVGARYGARGGMGGYGSGSAGNGGGLFDDPNFRRRYRIGVGAGAEQGSE